VKLIVLPALLVTDLSMHIFGIWTMVVYVLCYWTMVVSELHLFQL
jgi:hypothetical protein